MFGDMGNTYVCNPPGFSQVNLLHDFVQEYDIENTVA